MRREFKVGDRVVVHGYSDNGGSYDGTKGTIVELLSGEAGVVLDVTISNRNRLFRLTQLRHLKPKKRLECYVNIVADPGGVFLYAYRTRELAREYRPTLSVFEFGIRMIRAKDQKR